MHSTSNYPSVTNCDRDYDIVLLLGISGRVGIWNVGTERNIPSGSDLGWPLRKAGVTLFLKKLYLTVKCFGIQSHEFL